MTIGAQIKRIAGHFAKQTASSQGRDTAFQPVDAGDFHVDLQSQQATVRGKSLNLSAEEFDLLLFLLRHPRRVVTTRTQLNTRWEDEVHQIVFLRVLASLRRQIESAAGRAGYIRTEPWVLYRFETSR